MTISVRKAPTDVVVQVPVLLAVARDTNRQLVLVILIAVEVERREDAAAQNGSRQNDRFCCFDELGGLDPARHDVLRALVIINQFARDAGARFAKHGNRVRVAIVFDVDCSW